MAKQGSNCFYLLIAVGVLSLILASCYNRSVTVRVSELRQVSQTPYVFQPHITVDPLNSEHLGAIVISASQFDCDLSCKWELLVYTSMNGGVSWKQQSPFGPLNAGDGVVGFGPDAILYAVGVGGRGSIFINRSNPEGMMTLGSIVSISPRQANDKPWVNVNQRNGHIFVTYSGPTSDQYEHMGVLLQKSTDGGVTWSDPLVVEKGVDLSAWQAQQEVPPFGAQVMLGNEKNLAVAWTWSPGVDNFPFGVWVSTSIDNGETFSTPKQIGESWSVISTAYYQDTYYIFFKKGNEASQELVLAISEDNGNSWRTSVVSDDPSLFGYFDKAPGVNVAPHGTIDVIYYGLAGNAPDCIDLTAYRNQREAGFIDECRYNVSYTFSKDGGQTFSSPVKLNDSPISGSRFVRTQGFSRSGEYIGMASTDEYAYPIWIHTLGEDGSQAFTVQIER